MKKKNKGVQPLKRVGGATRGCNLPKSHSKDIAKIQLEILELLKQGKSQKEIALTRGVNKSSVSRTVAKLRKKGIWKGGATERRRGVQLACAPPSDFFRYHGLHFVIKPNYKTSKYDKVIKTRGNSAIKYGDWNIYLHSNSIQMRSRPGADFRDKDIYGAVREMQDSFNKELARASKDIGFKYDKERNVAIKQVRGELAHIEDGVAKNLSNGIQIRGKDGKIWFLVDLSKGLEYEYHHPETHIDNAETVEPYFNDFKDNSPPTNSKLQHYMMAHIRMTTRVNKDLSALIQSLNNVISTLTKAPQETKGTEENGVNRSMPARYIG